MGEWKERCWGDLVTLEYGKVLRDYATPGSVRVYGTNGPIGWTYTSQANGPGVIIGRKGAYRGVHYSPGPFWVIDTAYYLKPRGSLDLRWAYYSLKNIDINSMDSGSAIPSTSRNDFYAQRVIEPPLNEQEAIANILGTLDDKIAINARGSARLDEMSRLLYERRFGRHGDTSEWPKGSVSDLCSTQYGYTASAVEECVGPKFLRVKDINKSNWIDWENVPYCPRPEKVAKYELSEGDILVARMADPGKSAIVEQPMDAVFASYLVRLKTESLTSAYYVYGFLKSSSYAEYADSVRAGSVQANMNAQVIVGAQLPLPPEQVMREHLESVLPFRKRLTSTISESTSLVKLRDTLLPKLMSGELRVRDAEKVVEEST